MTGTASHWIGRSMALLLGLGLALAAHADPTSAPPGKTAGKTARPTATNPAPRPYRSTDLRSLLRKYRYPEVALEQVRQRGLDMTINASTGRMLRGMGFSDIQAGVLIRIARKDPDVAADLPDQPPQPGRPLRIGPRLPEQYQQAHSQRIDQIIKLTALPLQQYPCGHVTLVASQATAGKLARHIAATDALVRQRFPGAFRKGLDRRTAHIVVLDDTSAYRSWIQAVFQVYRQQGLMGDAPGGNDPMEFALKGSGWNAGHMTCNDASRIRNLPSKVAFDVGYLYASLLSEGQAPPALVCGFGNVIEDWMMGKPGTMLISYEDRRLDRPEAWAKLVYDRMTKRQHTPPLVALTTTLDVMKGPQYAECWSITELLCGAPGEFDRLLKALRDGQPFLDALQKVYHIDPQKPDLERAWMWHANLKSRMTPRPRH